MITRPDLPFLDEPTTGLDLRSREQVWGTVRGLVEEGVTVLLTTQYLEEADQLADSIALLDQGRIVARGSADQLKADFGGEVLRLSLPTSTRCAGPPLSSGRPRYTNTSVHWKWPPTARLPVCAQHSPGSRSPGYPLRKFHCTAPASTTFFFPSHQGANHMTIAPALTDSRVMIGRCLRRSRRDPEAFFTALILPIALMLLFVYVFGGALKTGVEYVDYVVPGLIVLCTRVQAPVPKQLCPLPQT